MYMHTHTHTLPFCATQSFSPSVLFCRYLWPLIHYHKFLAKCIKKMKRNGIDVKVSTSPVAIFLREEVCAVSDHLAAVSLFTSEQWMDCLQHFTTGWFDTAPESQAQLRELVSSLKLRPLNEPGDVDSPLLRSQIDEQFLKTVVAARDQMTTSRKSAPKPAAPTASSVSLGSGQSISSSLQSVGKARNNTQLALSGNRRNPGVSQGRHGLPLYPQTVSYPFCLGETV